MPTTRPRHQVTETPSVARALDVAARHWPGESRSKLLQRLVEAGRAALEEGREDAVGTRREAVEGSSGKYAEAFGDGYLAELRRALAAVITLDASVLVAHLGAGDPHHAAATAYLRGTAGEELVVHSLNLAEVLVGGVRVGRAEELLADLEAIGVRMADRREGEPLRLARLRAQTGLKLPDCCALDTALVTGSVLATFDAALARAARQRDLAVAPEGPSS